MLVSTLVCFFLGCALTHRVICSNATCSPLKAPLSGIVHLHHWYSTSECRVVCCRCVLKRAGPKRRQTWPPAIDAISLLPSPQLSMHLFYVVVFLLSLSLGSQSTKLESTAVGRERGHFAAPKTVLSACHAIQWDDPLHRGRHNRF